MRPPRGLNTSARSDRPMLCFNRSVHMVSSKPFSDSDSMYLPLDLSCSSLSGRSTSKSSSTCTILSLSSSSPFSRLTNPLSTLKASSRSSSAIPLNILPDFSPTDPLRLLPSISSAPLSTISGLPARKNFCNKYNKESYDFLIKQ